eukprot:scaffold23747_cov58-Phaeocystis_antarctica.AAC.3
MIHPYPGRPPHIELAAHQEGLAAHSRGELVYCTRIYPPCTFPHCKLEACVPALWLQLFSTSILNRLFNSERDTLSTWNTNMLWLVLLTSHSLAEDSPTPLAKASALSAPQRRDLPAATTASDAATKPLRDPASPDATMKRRPQNWQSEVLVSEPVPAGRALSEVEGAISNLSGQCDYEASSAGRWIHTDGLRDVTCPPQWLP